MLKNQKGITLIALVITIIVLLILAGVTIAMVVGDNGIITRSNEAKDTTNIKKIQEEVDLIAADLVAEYHSKDNGEVPSTAGKYVATNIADSDYKIEVTGSAINVIKDGKETKGEIKDDGHIAWDDEGEQPGGQGGSGGTPATSTIKVEDYGKYVDIGVDINGDNDTTNDFRVFLNDGSNVYLIAADYAPYSMLPYSKGNDTTNGHALNKNSDYSADFSTILSDYDGSENIKNNFNLQLSTYHKWINNNQTSTNSNIKSVAYMLDKTAWNSIYKTTGINGNSDYVDYVVGGPTLEQFAASFKVFNTNSLNQLFYNESGNTGYYVKRGQIPTTETYAQFSTAGNDLFFITSTTKAYCAWLASPSADGEDRVSESYYSGSVASCIYNVSGLGFRPLVCLKSGVSLIEPETEGGAYTLH
ncbi:MAG: prepilin-type N-terminal cleavage/methylation domain-containing protein [Clostridia bacterium]|nr:prepilin-type N-terminal cleavage/methylation domain-containing protein [Clostridia bacterium]